MPIFDKSLIQQLVEGFVQAFEWMEENMSKKKLHERILKTLDQQLKSENLDIQSGLKAPDLSLVKNKLPAIKAFIENPNPPKSDATKNIKKVVSLLQEVYQEIQNLQFPDIPQELKDKGISKAKLQLTYLGALFTTYWQEHSQGSFVWFYLLRFIDLVDSANEVGSRGIGDGINEDALNMLSDDFSTGQLEEKVGAFLTDLTKNPLKSFESVFLPMLNLFDEPLEMLKKVSGLYLESAKEIEKTTKLLEATEVQNEKLVITIKENGKFDFSTTKDKPSEDGDKGNETQNKGLDISLKVTCSEEDHLPRIHLTFNGGVDRLEKEISKKWKLVFKAQLENITVDLNPLERDMTVLNFDNDKNFIGLTLEKTGEITKETQLPSTNLQTQVHLGKFQISLSLSRKAQEMRFIFANSGLFLGIEDNDNFIVSHLPSKRLGIDFDLGLVVGNSSQRGFYIDGVPGLSSLKLVNKDDQSSDDKDTAATRGFFVNNKTVEKSAGYETTIPLNKAIGPLNVQNISLGAKAFKIDQEGGLTAFGTTGFTFKLGPVLATVEGIGVESRFTFSKKKGPDFNLKPKPPTGVGLSLTSEIISGGGFLNYDKDNHRYTGALTLNFQDMELDAVGIINTRLPNGQKGFSMILSISTLFNPGFQLAFGFTLNGVGGLIGIHRTMKVNVLRDRVANGSLNSIMFPRNVIANAPKIISDLRAVFPVQKHHYVVAPFFKIGWGAPTVMEVDLGLLVELPFKGRLILLGALGIYLPHKNAKKRLIEIHVDVFGDFNFSEFYILIEGRLRDSQVVGISLKGGFAFMMDWGQNPQFLLSIGGHHPNYKKPARFPAVPRLTALIKKGDAVSLTCEYYQAITSNSFQVGFSADLLIQKGGAKVTGFLGFNALIQFDPLYFEVDIALSVGVSYKGRKFAGIDIFFLLSGPKPWRVKGYVKISILFFTLKRKFDVSWGGEQKVLRATAKPHELLVKLQQQLEESQNWAGKLSPRFNPAASMRELDEREKLEGVFVHPFGQLEVRQNLLPLNKTLEKYGNQFMEEKTSYRIVNYHFGGAEITPKETLKEFFSRGQFEDLPDDKKLSTPNFEKMAAGVQLEPDVLKMFDFSDLPPENTSNTFEEIPLDQDEKAEGQEARTRNVTEDISYNWQAEKLNNFSGSRRTIHANREEEVFGMVDDVPEYQEKGYKILSKETMEAPEGLWDNYFWNYSAAKDYLHTHWPADEIAQWQLVEVEAGEGEKVLF